MMGEEEREIDGMEESGGLGRIVLTYVIIVPYLPTCCGNDFFVIGRKNPLVFQEMGRLRLTFVSAVFVSNYSSIIMP
jgi:hypothetical protein